jgi:hypothetical protein
MEQLPAINLIAMIHLIFLCLWGGVVAVESVIELYPFRKKDFHANSIEYHYWIDLLVELPLISLVIITGIALTVLAWPLSGLHLLKITCAMIAVSANLACIFMVVRRRRLLEKDVSDEELWQKTRRIILSAVIGLPLAAVAAGLGVFLAYQRMLEMLG